ncbi:MAG: S49 family peptidase [Bacteroidales bacterium]|nr:S49 family peptidase [Bacteroidales bacterium]
MAKRTNYLQLALDLRHGGWLIHDPDVLLPVVNAFLLRQPMPRVELDEYQVSGYQLSGGNAKKSGAGSKEPRVIVVPLRGSMTKYETCETYGTEDIASKMSALVDDPSVLGFVLDIDSGGGAANSVPPLVAAIARAKAAGKPVIAHVDACYSAAYWVASQCDAIFMNSELSGVGSIGAFAQILDNREDKQTGFKVITVYAPQSGDKNAAYREALDGKPERLQKELSDLVEIFHAAVRAGRPRLQAEKDGVLTGATFAPKKAISVGLADGMASLEECVENVFVRAEYN